jgi:hypothetical protein
MELPFAFIGIDPGAKGGLAVMDKDEKILYCQPIPYIGDEMDVRKVALVINHFKKTHQLFAAFERVGAMPGQGVCAMFSFGKTTGQLLAALKILSIPYSEPTPTAWKEVVLVGMPWKANTTKYKNDKTLSKEENERLKVEFKKLNGSKNNKAKKDAKMVSCEYVMKRFPNINIIAKKTPHDGMAESICLAVYAKHMRMSQ